MRFTAKEISLEFNKTTFGVEGMWINGEANHMNFCRAGFALPSLNNFLIKSDYSEGNYQADFQFFSELQAKEQVTEIEGGVLFSYEFINQGKEKMSFKQGALSVLVPFNDTFDIPEVTLKRRVHPIVSAYGQAHIRNNRYSGAYPTIGLAVIQGESFGYAVERGRNVSERGDISLLLPEIVLNSGEKYLFEFVLFVYHSEQDYIDKLAKFGVANITCSTLFPKQNESVTIECEAGEIVEYNGKTFNFTAGKCEVAIANIGENILTVFANKKRNVIKCFVLADDIKEKRFDFVLKNQYISQDSVKGAFCAYDTKEKTAIIKSGVRSSFNLAGYRAAPLLAMISCVNKGTDNEKIKNAIECATTFYDKELLQGGEVYDDIGKKRVKIGKKYYSYPLFSAIKYQEYLYKKDLSALMQSTTILNNFFDSSMKLESAPTIEVIDALRKEEKQVIADELAEKVIKRADEIIVTGNKYKFFKGINYGLEQVNGVATTLLDAYTLTKKDYYLMNVKDYIAMLDAFSAPALTYDLDNVPVTYLLDKGEGMVIDKSLHFALGAVAYTYFKYGTLANQKNYVEKAKKIILALLTLFEADGTSHRSKNLPKQLNDREISEYEKISCGEDIIFYFFDLIF